jgi:hypothetical protein
VHRGKEAIYINKKVLGVREFIFSQRLLIVSREGVVPAR